ncbi:MAG: hypothetical protein COW65_14645 [Cytophagales bacterium CG18_big_fil_WC_8_21_14_2_50_42_9]|nr:MAG: hypothetical protein COW65_14645 [Cytophagales bacterium CG18_big_fil_WC_8_21_14_2_50_42_9]
MAYQINPAEYFLTKEKNTGEIFALETKYYTLFISCQPHLLFPVFKLAQNQPIDTAGKFFKPKQEMRLLETSEDPNNEPLQN